MISAAIKFGLKDLKKRLKVDRRAFRKFLKRSEDHPIRGINDMSIKVEKKVWKEVDCLECANCCKKMTPTFSKTDVKRISAHFDQTPEEFTKKWLEKDSNKDMVNKKQPCQFLNLKDNKCSIYAIRPSDCSGFPHLSKQRWSQYANMHKQNIDYCPASFRMVEKFMEIFDK